jgi:hypothetical protein
MLIGRAGPGKGGKAMAGLQQSRSRVWLSGAETLHGEGRPPDAVRLK